MKTHGFVNRLEKMGLLRKLSMDPNDTLARKSLYRSYKIPPNIKFSGIVSVFKAVKEKLQDQQNKTDPSKIHPQLILVDFIMSPKRQKYHLKGIVNPKIELPNRSLHPLAICSETQTVTVQLRKDLITSISNSMRIHESNKLTEHMILATDGIMKLAEKDPQILSDDSVWYDRNSVKGIVEDMRNKNFDAYMTVISLLEAESGVNSIYKSLCRSQNNYNNSEQCMGQILQRFRRTVSIDDRVISPIAIRWDKLWSSDLVLTIVRQAEKINTNKNKVDTVKAVRKMFMWIEQYMFDSYALMPINSTNDWATNNIGNQRHYDPHVTVDKLAYRIEKKSNVKLYQTDYNASDKSKKIAQTAIKSIHNT